MKLSYSEIVENLLNELENIPRFSSGGLNENDYVEYYNDKDGEVVFHKEIEFIINKYIKLIENKCYGK